MQHLCLVSDQAMPNFLPCIDEALRPSRITLAVTKAMKNRADDLRHVLARYKAIEVMADLEIPDATDLAALTDRFTTWLDNHDGDDDEVCLNVTGGTKLMAIAAQECFRMAGKKVFYVDIGSDHVLWVDDPKREPSVLRASPSIEAAIELNGFDADAGNGYKPARLQDWRNFAKEASENIRDWMAALTYLNGAAQAGENENDTRLYPPDGGFYQWDAVLASLRENGLIKPEQPDGRLEFFNPDARDFVKGGWLEHYVRDICAELGFTKRSFRSNLTIKPRHPVGGNPTLNELDAVFLHRNSLYIVECKARNFRRGKKQGDARVDNALYKLAELTHQQGLRARGIFVSMKPLGVPDRNRANALNIKVFDNLLTLRDDLKKYLWPDSRPSGLKPADTDSGAEPAEAPAKAEEVSSETEKTSVVPTAEYEQLKADRKALTEARDALQARLDAYEHRSFFERLKALFRGR